MAREVSLNADAEAVARKLRDVGPAGMTAEVLETHFGDVSRSTLTRRLRALVKTGAIKVLGSGRSTRYVALASYGVEDVRRFFETDWASRPLATYREPLLLPAPLIESEMARRLVNLQARARALDKHFLADFLIDFSWASSVLEGSTYSNIDTQALIQYGERNRDKPVADAVLILNHKNAIQHLWAHRDLTTQNLCLMQAFLTDDHGLQDLGESDHFLPEVQRGRIREYEEVRLGRSAYRPPFRPATGYIRQAFEQIVATAATLPPVPSAFYLMTRIPYLQVFANGNKRTARLAANIPLLQAGLLPISFVDFNKASYVLAMAAFYELGDTQLMQRVFVEGYVRSIVRSSDIPASARLSGPSLNDTVNSLVDYVFSGKLPGAGTDLFLKHLVR